MRVTGILLALFVCLTSYLSAQQEGNDLVQSQLGKAFRGKTSLTVAVLDFVNIDGRQSILGRYFSEESANYLVKKSGVRLVERAQIRQLESEWDLSSTGLISDKTVVELGGMLGADAVVVGTLTLTGRRIAVHMRIVDTRTGVILSTGSSEISGAKYIRMYNDIVQE